MARTWVLTYDGEVYRQGDLTVGEAETVCNLTGRGWEIRPTDSVTALLANLAVFIARKGDDPVEALEKLRVRPLEELTNCFDWEDEDTPEEYEMASSDSVPMPAGKDEEGEVSSTTTSSSSTGGTSGRRGSRGSARSETSG